MSFFLSSPHLPLSSISSLPLSPPSLFLLCFSLALIFFFCAPSPLNYQTAACSHVFCRDCLLTLLSTATSAADNQPDDSPHITGSKRRRDGKVVGSDPSNGTDDVNNDRDGDSGTSGKNNGGKHCSSSGKNDGVRCPDCRAPLSVDLTSRLGDGGSGVQQQQQPAGSIAAAVAGGGGARGQGLAGGVVRSKASILHRIDLSRFQSSTKVEALVSLWGWPGRTASKDQSLLAISAANLPLHTEGCMLQSCSSSNSEALMFEVGVRESWSG